MSRALSLYAFRPGAPGVPPGSGTGVFVSGLVNALTEAEAKLEGFPSVSVRWLDPADRSVRGGRGGVGAAARWLLRELGYMLRDSSRYLFFVYPKVPVLAHVQEPSMLELAQRAYAALALKSRLTRQRILVLVEDLPIELTRGRAAAGAPRVDLPERQIRRIERTLFRAAHRVIVPHRFLETTQRLHDLDRSRMRTFRRNIYLPEVPNAPAETSRDFSDLGFEKGDVNFFYSGAIDAPLAPNFREVLRSIRNAPGSRLHVCGAEGDAVRDWFVELAVPNARHYGQLSVAAHDWLARQCDIGLILYNSDNPYNHLTPTMKYSAYLANGLAILSTDLAAVSENVERDRVGKTFPIVELSVEILRWATRPTLWADYRANAAALAPAVRSGAEMRDWIEEIALDR